MDLLPVRYSSDANRDYRKLIKRVRFKWGVRSAQKLDRQIRACEAQIAVHPEQYPRAAYAVDVRKCVVTKQTSLFYEIKATEILVVAVFDNRQDPETLKQRS